MSSRFAALEKNAKIRARGWGKNKLDSKVKVFNARLLPLREYR